MVYFSAPAFAGVTISYTDDYCNYDYGCYYKEHGVTIRNPGIIPLRV